MPTARRAEPVDLCDGMRRREARLCRIAGVAHPHAYSLACMSGSMAAIVISVVRFGSTAAPNAEDERSVERGHDDEYRAQIFPFCVRQLAVVEMVVTMQKCWFYVWTPR
jgi:hypothetical protein